MSELFEALPTVEEIEAEIERAQAEIKRLKKLKKLVETLQETED